MKYVRTKDDDIMTVEKRKEIIACARYEYRFKNFDIPIVKEADTIEDLCDEFCLTGNDGTRLVYNITDWKDLKHKILSNKAWIEIYGAIWTDKGLIYVAKLNKDGELELI